MQSTQERFKKLVDIMARLRAKDGCPWDQEQTHASLSRHALEEVYEVIETIDEGNYGELPKELGDLLLQVVFHAQIGKEDGRFDINDVLDHINDKLIRRHPHVFGDAKIDSAEAQTIAWEQTKMKREGKKSAIDGVPRQLPALLRAHRMQGKAAAVGFDWPELEPVWEKVDEEIEELRQAHASMNQDEVLEEFGDLLFSLVNLSRFLKVEPEEALRRACEKFEKRFKAVESVVRERGKNMDELDLKALDAIWDQVKKTA